MSTAVAEKPKKLKAKKALVKGRMKIASIKADNLPLGDESVTVIPDDLEIMFSGKMCSLLLEAEIRAGNTLFAFKKQYPQMPAHVQSKLDEMIEDFGKSFEVIKKKAMKVTEKSMLWSKLSGIKGFSSYQLALIMSALKDISRFETPSALCVYAGVSSLKGVAITKGNLNFIKSAYLEDGKEFSGFATSLSGRMFVIVDCLLRAKGYFYVMYGNLRNLNCDKFNLRNQFELLITCFV